jgi:hypothetical protein
MKKRPFLPKKQNAYLKWHDNLAKNVTAATPGATADDAATLAADNADLHAKSAVADTAAKAAKAAHQDYYKSVAASQTHARKLAKRIKNDANYTAALGVTLQLEGAEDSVDMTREKPALDATAKAGGVVDVDFNKMDAEGVHIYSQRDGDAGFVYLAAETHSPYVDNRPLLAPGKPEIRSYKAVFFALKNEIGLESDVVQATARP